MAGSVYLALDRAVLLQWVVRHKGWPSPLWVCADVLTDDELSRLRREGVNLSNFVHCVDAEDVEEVAEAKATIAEHHPGLSIVLI